MPAISPLALATPHSGIRRMAELGRKTPGALMLVSGDPNFATPGHIVDAAAAAAHRGATGYAPSAGIDPLRTAIVERIARVHGLTVGVEEVCVTTGGCGGLFTSLKLIVEPGDDVLIPDPGWSNYPAIVHSLGGRVVGYRLAGPTLAIDPEAVEAAITPRTRAIVVNSPSNPGGSVESEAALRAVLEIAERHDLWVVSDECYDELIFEGRHVPMARLGGHDRLVTVYTFSKSYAMTGWRVGYVVAPAAFAAELALHQEPVVSCTSTVSQHAALAALQGPQDCVATMTAAYKARRDVAMGILDDAGVGYVRPSGSFFLLARIDGTGLDSETAAIGLLQEEGIATVPGSAFGPGGDDYLRLSLAVADEVVAEGARRLVRYVERHGR